MNELLDTMAFIGYGLAAVCFFNFLVWNWLYYRMMQAMMHPERHFPPPPKPPPAVEEAYKDWPTLRDYTKQT